MRFSINKELFEEILLKKVIILEIKDKNYWKNELLEPFFENSKLIYKTKKLDKLILTNGLGNHKPQLVVECLNVDYSIQDGLFKFNLGKILEQKNIIEKYEDKDKIIEQLIEENIQLKKRVKMVQGRIDF